MRVCVCVYVCVCKRERERERERESVCVQAHVRACVCVKLAELFSRPNSWQATGQTSPHPLPPTVSWGRGGNESHVLTWTVVIAFWSYLNAYIWWDNSVPWTVFHAWPISLMSADYSVITDGVTELRCWTVYVLYKPPWPDGALCRFMCKTVCLRVACCINAL